jgi:hypothetical protein
LRILCHTFGCAIFLAAAFQYETVKSAPASLVAPSPEINTLTWSYSSTDVTARHSFAAPLTTHSADGSIDRSCAASGFLMTKPMDSIDAVS